VSRLLSKADVFAYAHPNFLYARDALAQPRTRLAAGVRVIRTPYRAPNCNAYAERFVRSIQEECLDRMIFFGESALRRALREFVAHYHGERNHPGIDNRLIEWSPPSSRGAIECREQLGGLLRFCDRAA
jgi:putative transposase